METLFERIKMAVDHHYFVMPNGKEIVQIRDLHRGDYSFAATRVLDGRRLEMPLQTTCHYKIPTKEEVFDLIEKISRRLNASLSGRESKRLKRASMDLRDYLENHSLPEKNS